jgi:hypothetical protein
MSSRTIKLRSLKDIFAELISADQASLEKSWGKAAKQPIKRWKQL